MNNEIVKPRRSFFKLALFTFVGGVFLIFILMPVISSIQNSLEDKLLQQQKKAEFEHDPEKIISLVRTALSSNKFDDANLIAKPYLSFGNNELNRLVATIPVMQKQQEMEDLYHVRKIYLQRNLHLARKAISEKNWSEAIDITKPYLEYGNKKMVKLNAIATENQRKLIASDNPKVKSEEKVSYEDRSKHLRDLAVDACKAKLMLEARLTQDYDPSSAERKMNKCMSNREYE